jgi:adenine-specific DNA-methyltransferase
MPELIWEGKDAVINYHHSLPVRELKIDQDESLSPEPSLDDNLIIEGDNIEVLKSLIPKFASKIDVIYIDPPYNTGNENWVYNDNLNSPQIKSWLGNVVGKEDLQRHDKWLCMMYPRLVLARELLSESGVIFISIDDNEVHNLNQLLNEIFGEPNSISTLIVKMSHLSGVKMSHIDKGLAKLKEYVLIFSKNKNNILINPVYEKSSWKEAFNRYRSVLIRDENDSENLNKWSVMPLGAFTKKANLNIKDQEALENFYYSNASRIFRTATNDSEEFTKLPKDNKFREVLTKTGLKKYAFKGEEVLFASNKIKDNGENDKTISSILGDIWMDIGINNLHNEGYISFQNGKKPLKLIKNLISMCSHKSSLILDFFAGSGTTGHAVLEMNKEDGGNRKFILIQQPEESEEASKQNFKNIFEITTARIRHCIEGVKTAKDPKLQEGLGGSFTVVKLGEVLHLNTLFLEKDLPSYEALASYLFYHTTNQALSNVTENASHYIGKTANYKLYLIYSADKEKLKHHDYALSRSKLEQILKDCDNGYQALIYAVTIYVDNKSIKSLMEKEKYTKKPIICQIPYQYLQINSANVLNNLEDSED